MSQNTNGNDHSGIVFVIALVGAGAMFLAALVYALFLFGALVLTLIAFCAWNKPVTIGKVTLEPDEARAFVRRGLIGAFVLPAFVVFIAVLFGGRIDDDFWLHLMLGGYALGSLGVAMLEESDETEAGGTIQHLPAPPPAQIAPPKDFIPQRPAPFRFARWDDEEERS